MASRNIPLATYNLIASQAQPQRAVAGYVAAHGQPGPGDAGAEVYLKSTSARTRNNPDTSIRCDVELARIAVGLKQSALLQRWLLLTELARTTGRQGFTRAQFDAALQRYGVRGCDAYNTRLLHRGHGLYWNVHDGMIYPCGYVTLCKRLIIHAASHGLYDLFSTNRPGDKRAMYLDVRGSINDFEAAVLNGWYASKNNPMISRAVLVRLFNRTEKTLRKMERRAGITVVSNTLETLEPAAIPLNADGSHRGDVRTHLDSRGHTIYSFNLSNTYHSGICRQHPARGQSRRASYSIRTHLDGLLAGSCGAGGGDVPGQLNRTGKLYCADYKAARLSQRRGNENPLAYPDRPGEGGGVVWVYIPHSRGKTGFAPRCNIYRPTTL